MFQNVRCWLKTNFKTRTSQTTYLSGRGQCTSCQFPLCLASRLQSPWSSGSPEQQNMCCTKQGCPSLDAVFPKSRGVPDSERSAADVCGTKDTEDSPTPSSSRPVPLCQLLLYQNLAPLRKEAPTSPPDCRHHPHPASLMPSHE